MIQTLKHKNKMITNYHYNIAENQKNVVYSSEKLVSNMLACIKDEIERIDSRVLEPACGNGNFLDATLRNKLYNVVRKYSHSRIDFEYYIIHAIKSLYGVEIEHDVVIKCRSRLLQTVREFYCKYYSSKESWDNLNSILTYVLNINIICGDALSLTNPQTGEPIVFAEWSFLNSFKVKRRDFVYEQLINPSDNAERVISDQNKEFFIPKPVKDYPIVKVFNILSYAKI